MALALHGYSRYIQTVNKLTHNGSNIVMGSDFNNFFHRMQDCIWFKDFFSMGIIVVCTSSPPY